MKRIQLLGLSLCLVIISIACGGASDPGTPVSGPIVKITSPPAGSVLPLNQETLITFNTADAKGIAQVELSIDGEPVMIEPIDPPVNAYTTGFRWKAGVLGEHTIELQAFNVDQEASEPVQITVSIVESSVETGPIPTDTSLLKPTLTAIAARQGTTTPTPIAARVLDSTPLALDNLPPTVEIFTPVPSSSGPPPAPVNPSSGEAVMTTVIALFVRSGPSTTHQIVGRLGANESALITGRDDYGGWWQIEYQSDQGDRGWVAAGEGFTQAVNAENVPVVNPAP
ncbi:MAG TPA: SH3 domain-containing protein [Anaerolineae bacterium]|nr:SH3 domain-containing protein [Anaerolineae bacterium]